jgi:cobalt/nickel transport system permease protein
LLGLQPHLAPGPDGKPLYFPLDLSATLPGMLIPHLLVAGFVEAAVTAAGYAYLVRAGRRAIAASPAAAGAEPPVSWLYWGLVGAIVLAPLGLLAPGTAWGEWATEDVRKMVGYLPQGLARLSDRWRTPLADYHVGAAPSTFVGSALGYYLCAVLGAGAILALVAMLGRALAVRSAVTEGEGA